MGGSSSLSKHQITHCRHPPTPNPNRDATRGRFLQGSYSWPNGKSYVGNYKDGKRSGQVWHQNTRSPVHPSRFSLLISSISSSHSRRHSHSHPQSEICRCSGCCISCISVIQTYAFKCPITLARQQECAVSSSCAHPCAGGAHVAKRTEVRRPLGERQIQWPSESIA